MDRLFKTFVYAFLWSLSLVCAAKNDTVTVIQTLPKVECANKILDNEIRHYLAQQDSTDQVCFFVSLIISLIGGLHIYNMDMTL